VARPFFITRKSHKHKPGHMSGHGAEHRDTRFPDADTLAPEGCPPRSRPLWELAIGQRRVSPQTARPSCTFGNGGPSHASRTTPSVNHDPYRHVSIYLRLFAKRAIVACMDNGSSSAWRHAENYGFASEMREGRMIRSTAR
jgi:hypothetical protein